MIALFLALQAVTLGFGEERQSKVWRTWAPRWDVYTVEASWGPVVVDVAHKRGVAGLNPDRRFPTASFGLRQHIAKTGPIKWDVRGLAFVDFGHISNNEGTRWTPGIGLWAKCPVWGRIGIRGSMYLRKPGIREARGQQSWFRAEAGMGLKLWERANG